MNQILFSPQIHLTQNLQSPRLPTEAPLVFLLGGWEATTCTRRAPGAGQGYFLQLTYMQRQRQPHLAKNFLNVPSLCSGQPFGYTNWIEGEPNDSNGLEDCIAIDRSVEEGS